MLGFTAIAFGDASDRSGVLASPSMIEPGVLAATLQRVLTPPGNPLQLEIYPGVDLVVLVSLAVGLAAVVLSTLGKKAGLVTAAAAVLALSAYVLALQNFAIETWAIWNVVWTAVMLAVGFGFEPFVARLGVRLFRLDRNVMMGAAIGMIVALFVGPGTSGLTLMVFGALLGALAGGLFSGVSLDRAFRDAVGALLGLFGAEGIRLMATLSVVALLVRTAGMVP